MNPLKLMQIKNSWQQFANNHPKFPMFLAAVQRKGLKEGTVLEISVTTPEGETITSNIKLKAEDLAIMQELLNP